MAKTWFSRLFSHSSRRTAARRAKQNKFTKSFLACDRLEDRTVPATYSYDPAFLRLTITMDGTEGGLTAGIQGLNLYVYEQTPTQAGSLTAVLKDTRSIVGAAAVTNISLVGSSGNDLVFFTPGAAPSNVYGNGASQHTLNPVPFPTTLNGMAGDDSITGGNGADTLIGNLGNDQLSGANGTDTVVEVMAASPGTFTISNNLGAGPGGLTGGGTGTDTYPNDPISGLPTIERASLVGGAGDDTFNIDNWSGTIVLDGAGGNDTVTATNDSSMFLTNTALVRLIAGSATMLSIERVNLAATNPLATHTFTVSGWTNPELAPGVSPVSLTGASLNDQVSASADADFSLTDARLERLSGSTLITSFKLNNSIGKALLSGGGSDNKFIIGTPAGQWTGLATLNGGGGNDTLDYSNETTANFTLSAAGAGTGTQAGVLHTGNKLDNFSSIESLIGALNGSSTITGANATNTWAVTGANAGSIQVGTGIVTAFSGIKDLLGGTGNDAFKFSVGGTVNTINGQAGTDLLDYSNYTTNASVALTSNTSLAGPFTSTNAVTISFGGTATGINTVSNGFLGFEGVVGNDTTSGPAKTTLIGLAGNTGGTATPATIGGSGGLVNFFLGGTGIQGARSNATGTWNVASANTGTVTYGSIITQGSSNATNVAVGNGVFSFANVGNLKGGAAGSQVPLPETFKMANGASLLGTIDGGNAGGPDNILDYSAFTGPITVNVNTGTAPSLNGGAGNAFTNISSLIGSAGNDTLVGRNANNVWTIGSTSKDNAGSLNNNTTGTPVPLGFSSIENLTGGTADDVFQMANNVSLSGAISDQGGSTYGIFYDNSYSNAVTVGLNDDGGTSSATGVGGGMLQSGNRVNLVIGNFNPDSKLVGRNANANWFLSAGDASGIIQYTGGASAGDIIQFFSMANLTGGSGTDNLDASAVNGPITFNLQPGTGAIGISGFESFKGNDAPKSDMVGGSGAGPTTNNTTLIGLTTNGSWTISGPNSGQVSYLGGGVIIPFSQIGNITGGLGNDSFLFTTTPATLPGALSGRLDGGAGNDLLDLSGYTTPIEVNLGGKTQTQSGSVIIGGGLVTPPTTPAIQNFESIAGGQSTSDILTGSNTTTVWVIDGVNTGTVNGARFTGFESLKGGLGNDTFSILNGGQLSLATDLGGSDTLSYQSYTGPVVVDLQAGTAPGVTSSTFALIENFIGNDGTTGANSTLRGKDEGGVFTINNANSGTYKASSALTPSNFAGFGNLTGGSATDQFNITTKVIDPTTRTNGSLSGKLDAGGGADLLNYDGYLPNTSGANPVLLTLTSLAGTATPLSATGTGTGIAGGFISIENLFGNDSTTSTTNTTLSSFGSANWTWNVTGSNSGTVTNDTVTAGAVLPFAQVANLAGGVGNDTFIFSTGALSGTVAGNGGTNVVDYSLVPTGTPVAITLTGLGAGTSQVGSTVGGFSSIQSIKGNNNTLLTGQNASSTWNINGPNSGTVDGLASGFTGVSSVTGGAASDTFNINTGGSLSGFLSGGGGSNLLSYAGNTSNVDINLGTFVATSLGGFDPATISVLVGNGDNSALTGRNGANGTWTITSQNTGNVFYDNAPANFSFTGFGFLAGGNGNDSFTINPGASLTVALDGGGGLNDLKISVPTNVTISDSLLITGSGTTTSIANFQNATLIGTGSNALFDVSGWTQNLSITAGGGTNTLVASGDTDYTLTNSKLTRSNSPANAVNFTNIQRAILSGGSNSNQFDISDWTLSTNRVTCNGGGGNDRIVAQASSADAATITLNNSSLNRVGLAPATLVSIEQAVIVGGTGANNINAQSFGGSAVLIGGAGNDSIVGGVGNDTVLGGAGDDNINGGGGNDVVVGGSGSDIVNGGAGDDRVSGDIFNNPSYYNESTAVLNPLFQVPLFFNSPLSSLSDSQFVGPAGAGLANDTLDQILGGGGTDTAYIRVGNPDGDKSSTGTAFAVTVFGIQPGGPQGDITNVFGY